MSDPYGSYPPDEPVIGASVPPPLPRTPGGAVDYAPAEGYYDDGAEWDDEADGAYDDEYGYDEEEYGYYDEPPPARQPMFYLFLAMTVLVGAAIVVLLFSLVGSRGGGDEPTPTSTTGDFRVALDSPGPGDRVNIGQKTQVTVSATSNETIVRFELFVDSVSVDQIKATPPATGDVYLGVMSTTFTKKGEHDLFVRVHGESGATKDTDTIKVQAVEDVGDQPVRVQGRVLTTVTLREGPGNDFASAGTLASGREVTITGRTRNSEWLLLDIDGGRWVPSTAIEPLDSIEFVPYREPTPTPQPTATPTIEASPTPSPTPTGGTRPDFVPVDAILIDGGRALRITISNQSANGYNGPLVVSATGIGAVPPSKAFNVSLPANGSTTVDFDIDPPLTEAKTVSIKVDPDNALPEANEDNNVANIPLSPPVEPPSISIESPTLSASAISIVVRNTGGELASAEISVSVQVTETGETVSSPSKTIALAKGQGEPFSVSRPQGTGAATITVLVDGTPMASTTVQLGP